ncbi:MAG: CsiV family protein [Granulosicoccaceae bacterium]
MQLTTAVLTLRQLMLAVLLLGLGGMAHAKDYLIEMIVFEHVNKDNAIPGSLYYPKLSSSMSLTSERAQNAGFELITDGLSMAESADKIKSQSRYRMLKHFAWRQPGLERKEAKAVRINIGRATTMYLPQDLKPYKTFIPASSQPQADRTREIRTTAINGTIKVSLGRFLHMDVHMVFTDPETGTSYGMSQSRKMRSRELHYIDNQRFGILTRILPIEGNAGS